MWQIRMSKRRNLKIVFDSRVWSCYDPFHKLLGPIPKTMNGFSTAKYSENVSFDKKIQNLTTLRVMKSLKRLNLLITMILSMCRKGEALSKRKTMRGRQIETSPKCLTFRKATNITKSHTFKGVINEPKCPKLTL